MDVHTFELSEEYRTDLEALLFQLSGKKRTACLENLPNAHCIGAFEDSRLIGFAQLFILPKVTFTIGHLEDVIVREEYRNRGIGRKILEVVIETARKAEVSAINLTTRSERKAALRLFQSIGFEHPGNTTYRLVLK